MADIATKSLNLGNRTYICQNTKRAAHGVIWYSGNPLKVPYSLFMIEFSVFSSVSLLFEFLLKPLGQSKLVSHLLSGLIFGPSVLGNLDKFSNRLFPIAGLNLVKNVAIFNLMFFVFLLGLKMNLGMMFQPGRKGKMIGLTLFLFSTTLPMGLSLMLSKIFNQGKSPFFIAATQHLTACPVVASLLTELKLINTNLGRLALSTAMFANTISISVNILFFSFNYALTSDMAKVAGSLLTPMALVIVIVFIFRPTIMWMFKNSPDGKPDAGCIFCVFLIVIISGILSEIAGQHYGLGPLVLGFVVPEGPPLGSALESKLDSFISSFFFPLFLAILGMETDVFKIHFQAFWTVALVVVLASVVKILAVMLPGIYYEMPKQEAFVLGLILNARGSIDLMMFSIWKDSKLLTEEYFALGVLSVLVVMAIITPLIKQFYDPSSQYISSNINTIQHAKRDSEFRILVCIQNQDNIPAVINLLDASCAAQDSPIFVTAMILVEIVGRATPLLFLNDDNHKTNASSSAGPIVNALRIYEEHNQGNAMVESFTSISHIHTMYDNICQMACDKRAKIIIMPFHKQWAIDGGVESVSTSLQSLNINVLNKAPCSVGILVDRGMANGSVSVLARRSLFQVAALYIGGPDDNESLSYAFRMARHESVRLVVIRVLQFGAENTKDRKRGSNLIDEYIRSNMGKKNFEYVEEVVKDGSNLAERLMGLVDSFDLILVGRYHPESEIFAGLEAWSECRELGVVGDMLASPDFPTNASVLVVQQQRIRQKLMMRSERAGNNVEAGIPYNESDNRFSISVVR